MGELACLALVLEGAAALVVCSFSLVGEALSSLRWRRAGLRIDRDGCTGVLGEEGFSVISCYLQRASAPFLAHR